MTTLRDECDDDVTAVSDLERILRDDLRIDEALSAAQAFQNPRIASQSLKGDS